MIKTLREIIEADADARERMSQELLAANMGVKQPTISRWLNGHTRVPAEQVKKFSDVTGIPKETIRPDLFG